jgi:microcystin-dependent protein
MATATPETAVDAALPVGSVLAYAGRVPGALADQGWLLCDGSVRDRDELPELFTAIYFSFGQVTDRRFNLPDLRGLFVRCTCPDPVVRAQRDPDWERRSALNPAGNTREKVGSYEDYGTAKPRVPFQSKVEHLDIRNWHDDAGCASRPGKHNDDAREVAASGGGDLETRPVNKYVHFLIKAASTTRAGGPVVLPAGAVLPYAGPATDLPRWLRCDGRALSRVGQYAALFQAVQYAHGSEGDDRFVLPDYRGWFLRGVSGDTNRHPDPDRGSRTAPHAGGNTGNDVGSAQPWSTALPLNPFYATFRHLPTSDASKLVGGNLWNLLQVNGGSRGVSLTNGGGGDAESRPENLSVDFYVCAEPMAGADAAADVPIGAVATIGLDLPENPYWLPCDGRMVATADHPELSKALGATYGTSEGKFGLPDYRARFLRGSSDTTGIDPDADRRIPAGTGAASGVGSVQAYATGRPGKEFTTSVPNLPASTIGAHGATNSGNAGDNGTLTFDPWSKGGDGDTRPNNVYLNFYIRAR